MKFNLVFLCLISFFSCQKKEKNYLIIYPEYCGGCIVRNFTTINKNEFIDEFSVLFDTTDLFILEQAKQNKLNYTHLNNSEIYEKFGDFANLVIVNKQGKSHELSTNETIQKGIHF
ncbi:MAG: hypothetical protein M9916_05635 [Crocinitomicaceae bacterium]|jgi:hypothetical protein|nr:hypothetical protein [Crocinitomicaceae bacterium]